MRRVSPSRLGCRRLKALAGDPSPFLPPSPLFSPSSGALPPSLPFVYFRRGGGSCSCSQRRGACVERGGGGQSDVKGPYGFVPSLKVCSFPAWFVCVLQEGCSCCYVACVASVVARCVRAVVAWLAVGSLAMVSPVWRTIAGKSRCSALGHLRRIW
ncbi:hypothetical protein Taro_030626, partial [Colocasia esculenta]|nr:hypothetical protein [Colocasia esculenta]